ncbi:hypothetical protein HMPREF9701_06431, partial [Delftia acidovorans CCUG 274B]
NAFPSQPNAGPGKTREQVVMELVNESPAERDARLRLYNGYGG